jgi:rare lipoprotein A
MPLRIAYLAWIVVALALAPGCSSTAKRSQSLVDRQYPRPAITMSGTEVGVSSWYGPGFHGHSTASGERYDQDAMTAAHRSLPLGTWIDVRNLTNDRTVRVRVNDRGPYKQGRVLDLSHAAARALDIVHRGTAKVEIRLADRRYRAWPTVRYCVQVGAFRTRREADAVGRRLATQGETAYLKFTGRSDFPFSVRIGPFADRADALETSHRLRRLSMDALLVEEDPPDDVYASEAKAALPDRLELANH